MGGVDAETASANKRSIHMHFGTKEELFDMVVADSMAELAAAVSIDAGHLPGYAGALFDQVEQRPHAWDTASWSLKAPQAETGHESFTGRRAAVTAAVADSSSRPGHADQAQRRPVPAGKVPPTTNERCPW